MRQHPPCTVMEPRYCLACWWFSFQEFPVKSGAFLLIRKHGIQICKISFSTFSLTFHYFYAVRLIHGCMLITTSR